MAVFGGSFIGLLLLPVNFPSLTSLQGRRQYPKPSTAAHPTGGLHQ